MRQSHSTVVSAPAASCPFGGTFCAARYLNASLLNASLSYRATAANAEGAAPSSRRAPAR
jgi:hypothetical protein